MESLRYYEQLAEVPKEALKPILGGRLKGMSDINPMWRIKQLTEVFGPCGIGWKYEILRQQVVDGANGEKAAFVDINLYYKDGEEWSEPIPGSGGSMFVSKEKNGLYTDDECFKKALTDAIGVAGKALGLAATVYWQKDSTKYNAVDAVKEMFPGTEEMLDNLTITPADVMACEGCGAGMTSGQITLSQKKYDGKTLCVKCQKEVA